MVQKDNTVTPANWIIRQNIFIVQKGLQLDGFIINFIFSLNDNLKYEYLLSLTII